MKRLSVAFLTIILLLPFIPIPKAEAQTPTYITVNLSSWKNTQDFPYGIYNDGAGRVWMGLAKGCGLVEIISSSKTVSAIRDSGIGSGDPGDCYNPISDGDGNLWIPDRQKGKIWKYNIAGNNWTSYCLTPDIAGTTKNYNNSGCDRYKVDASGNTYGATVTTGVGTKVGSSIYLAGFFDLQFTNDPSIARVKWSGVYKLNPTDGSSTRITVGTNGIQGLKLDSGVLWLSAPDKVYKFDPNTDTVSSTFSGLTQGFNLDTDANFVYVTRNDEPTIFKVAKSNGAVTSLSTGGSGGRYAVRAYNNYLFWSGIQSSVGLYNLNNGATTVYVTNTEINHFMDVVGTEMWFAGKGSAETVIIPIPSESGGPSGGGSTPTPTPVTSTPINPEELELSRFYETTKINGSLPSGWVLLRDTILLTSGVYRYHFLSEGTGFDYELVYPSLFSNVRKFSPKFTLATIISKESQSFYSTVIVDGAITSLSQSWKPSKSGIMISTVLNSDSRIMDRQVGYPSLEPNKVSRYQLRHTIMGYGDFTVKVCLFNPYDEVTVWASSTTTINIPEPTIPTPPRLDGDLTFTATISETGITVANNDQYHSQPVLLLARAYKEIIDEKFGWKIVELVDVWFSSSNGIAPNGTFSMGSPSFVQPHTYILFTTHKSLEDMSLVAR